MAIITEEVDQGAESPAPKPSKVVVETAAYRGVAVDTARYSIDSLVTYVEGYPWTVNYYSQVLSEDSEVNSQQLDLAAPYQQYIAVRDMEIKVGSPLDHSMNTPAGSMTVTGTAVVYPKLIPNQGDMFSADVGGGHTGLFTVTAVRRLTILRETCHEIEYEMVNHLTETYRKDLERKTIKTVYFRKDFLLRGQNPLLVTEEVDLVERLERHQKELLGKYLAEFYSREYNTLLVPNSRHTLYDSYLTKTIKSVFDVNEHPLLRELDLKNCDDHPLTHRHTIWDCLMTMDITLLPLTVKFMKDHPTRQTNFHPSYRGIGFSGIRYLVYPWDVDAPLPPVDEPLDPIPAIFPVEYDPYYVLSQAFYDDLASKSVLETEVTKALRGEVMNHQNLDTLAQDSIGWGALERFYYLPVLMILIKTALRRL